MKKSAFLLTAAVGLLFTACTKEENNTVANNDNLVVGKWRLTYAKLFYLENGQVKTEVDSLSKLDSCALDDLMDFKADHKAFTNQGEIQCKPFDPAEKKVGTWQLLNNNQTFILGTDSPSLALKYRVLELTASRMQLYQDSTVTAGGLEATTKSIVIFEK